jgi:Ca2+-binding RTX toxin-like protein
MSIQSAQFDAGASAAAHLDRAGYWNNPADPNHGHDHGTDALGSEAPAPRGLDLDGKDVAVDAPEKPEQQAAVEVDGTATNSGERSQRSTPDGKPILVDPLHRDSQVEIARERTNADGYVSSDQLVFTTGAGDDTVGVKQRDDGTLDVQVNGESYEVRLGEGQELTIRAGAGDDVIEVAPNVRVNIVVEGGDGNDTITTGAGDDRIDGGKGDDVISSGAGRDDIFGNSGNDTITGGEGVNIVHGGDGDDQLIAGSGTNFIEGGAGNDTIQGGGISDILSGGTGNDRIAVGDGASRVYAGAGDDVVDNAGDNTVVHAEIGDLVNAATNASPTVLNVAIDANAGSTIRIEGSEAFVQRIQAEMDFLRASPVGQQMLAEFDQAADAKGNTVTIKELANEQNGYAQTFSRDADIRNGRAGAGGDVDISYNPSFHMDAFPAPVVVLYHEMSHAYNGVNGTFQPGTYRGEGPDSGRVPNAERQAVGLETSAAPFDFDGDPSTPATTSNPDHLTENGFREELGLPDRPSYAL